MLSRPGAARHAAFVLWAGLGRWPWRVGRDVCDGIALVLTDWLDRAARAARLLASAPRELTEHDINAAVERAGKQWFSPPPPPR